MIRSLVTPAGSDAVRTVGRRQERTRTNWLRQRPKAYLPMRCSRTTLSDWYPDRPIETPWSVAQAAFTATDDGGYPRSPGRRSSRTTRAMARISSSAASRRSSILSGSEFTIAASRASTKGSMRPTTRSQRGGSKAALFSPRFSVTRHYPRLIATQDASSETPTCNKTQCTCDPCSSAHSFNLDLTRSASSFDEKKRQIRW
jgi:hypothetical protein